MSPVFADIDRFCRLQCAYGPAGLECLDCYLFRHRGLDETERLRLFGQPGEEEW